MNHLDSYLKLVGDNSHNGGDIVAGISETVEQIVVDEIEPFDFRTHRNGLLLGHVQSGKTGHMFGVIAAAADHGFEIFVVLTTDNVDLQQQTLARAFDTLDTFERCDEGDDVRFIRNKMRKPVLIVLKKNANRLQKWIDTITESGYLEGRPIFIVDDESDAASLNTLVNDGEISRINDQISTLRKKSNSSFYLQVTATPQSLLLQTSSSDYKPEFVHAFLPGRGYLGGDFFYSDPAPVDDVALPMPIRLTPDDELTSLLEDEDHIPEGLIAAVCSFLVISADIHLSGHRSSSNFLVHPSLRKDEHELFSRAIGTIINNLLVDDTNADSENLLKEAWIDARSTKPDITSFRECKEWIQKRISEEAISISIFNSDYPRNVQFDVGTNIVVGGNSLGRGVTFPNLQVTYYCRSVKRPQLDTIWQHGRAFGYDREPALVRMFMPIGLFQNFKAANNSTNIMMEQIAEGQIDDLVVVLPKNMKPTRSNVVDQSFYDIITGGVNYFPSTPTTDNLSELDKLLLPFADHDGVVEVDYDDISWIIPLVSTDSKVDWDVERYVNCTNSVKSENRYQRPLLLVRSGRDISPGTGTLLSPTDREIGNSHPDRLILTAYRITGNGRRGNWEGGPRWIPNIKFPKGLYFHGV